MATSGVVQIDAQPDPLRLDPATTVLPPAATGGAFAVTELRGQAGP